MRSLVIVVSCLLLGGNVASQVKTPQTAATAATEYLQIAQNKIAYRSIGSGRPLILLTRMRGTLDTWDPLFLDQLAETHRVITVDYPGIGYSSGTLPTDAADVAAFVNALGIA